MILGFIIVFSICYICIICISLFHLLLAERSQFYSYFHVFNGLPLSSLFNRLGLAMEKVQKEQHLSQINVTDDISSSATRAGGASGTTNSTSTSTNSGTAQSQNKTMRGVVVGGGVKKGCGRRSYLAVDVVKKRGEEKGGRSTTTTLPS
jgi:hypothetical protein